MNGVTFTKSRSVKGWMTSKMKIVVCGSRDWDNYSTVYATIKKVASPDDIIIHGACRGADWLARSAARALGLAIDQYPAEWARLGRAAGPIRNQKMIDEEHPDLVIAFHLDIDKSKGTKDMVGRARAAGIPVMLIDQEIEENF